MDAERTQVKPKPTSADLVIVKLQIVYLARPRLRVKEGFMDKLYENIEKLHLGRKLEEALLAVVIKARGSPPAKREELCGRALDALECLG